jgi:hypothetical protein
LINKDNIYIKKKKSPKETWRRTAEKDLKQLSMTWGNIFRPAADRRGWRLMIEALCEVTKKWETASGHAAYNFNVKEVARNEEQYLPCLRLDLGLPEKLMSDCGG